MCLRVLTRIPAFLPEFSIAKSRDNRKSAFAAIVGYPELQFFKSKMFRLLIIYKESPKKSDFNNLWFPASFKRFSHNHLYRTLFHSYWNNSAINIGAIWLLCSITQEMFC